MNSNSNQENIDSNNNSIINQNNNRINKTHKRKIKLCEDIDYQSNQSLNESDKKRLIDKIVAKLEEIEGNVSTDPNCNTGEEYLFDRETKLTIDETYLQLKERLFQLSEGNPNSDHYFKIIKDLTKTENKLKNELNLLKREQNLYQKWIKTKEQKYRKTLIEEKRGNWCRICLNRAVEPYHCCRTGYYCSFSHFTSDKTHFIDCKKYENIKPNPYSEKGFDFH